MAPQKDGQTQASQAPQKDTLAASTGQIVHSNLQRYSSRKYMTIGGMSFRCFALGLLNRQSMSGYDIKRLLEGMCDESDRASSGWQLALDYGLALVDTQLAWLDQASDRKLE
jgi:hypothetical protein